MNRTLLSGIRSAFTLAAIAGAMAAATACAQDEQLLYSDTFSGTAGLLNGVGVEGGSGAGTLWSANSAFNANGTINGTDEGSALLPFSPEVNRQYVVMLTLANTTDRWLALGFGNVGLVSPGVSRTNDRFANDNRGVAWMLFRQHLTDATQNIQLFGGLGTANPITDDNRAIDFGVSHHLAVAIDTTGDGTSFTADFFLDGFSILPGGTAITVAQNIDAINFVGLSFDNATTSAITFDNFNLIQTPEPSSAAILGLGLLAWVIRRQRKA